MNTLTLLVLCASLHNQVLGLLKNGKCSSPDKDGLVHFPDLPVDTSQLADAEVVTHTMAFNIFSTTPDCSGTIIGADFCYALMSDTDTEQRRVFQLVRLDQQGDTFIPNSNYTNFTFTAIPIDRTKCTQQQNGRTVCCQRNTLSETMRLEPAFSFGIIAQNYANTDYPLLMFRASRKENLVHSYRVDYGRLGFPDDVFSNVYDSYNTIETTSNSPMVRLLIEPDNNSIMAEETGQNRPDLLAAVWCLASIAIAEGVALAVCVTLTIMAVVRWRKLKETQQLKSRLYKKTLSTEGILPPPTSTATCGALTYTPPIPMRVVYNNSMNSQLNSSYNIEPLPILEEESEELDYDNIVDSV